MNHLVLMATPAGKWVLPSSEEFFGALGDPDPDYDSVSFAVRNLGFVKLGVLDHTLMEIELHPRNVEKQALRAVIEQIVATEIKLFRIKYFDGHWRSEISASAEHTVARLEELCAPVFRPARTTQFNAEPRSIPELLDDRAYEDHAFRPLAQKWRVSFGHFDQSVLQIASNCDLLDRLTIVRVKPPENDAVFRYFGPGHGWITEDWKFNGIGRRVEDLPDKAYGKWAAGFYRSVATTGEPRLDRITAAISYEAETDNGRPRQIVSYDRLLLPWKAGEEGIFVTSCSKLIPVGAADRGEANLAPSGSDSSLSRNSAKSS